MTSGVLIFAKSKQAQGLLQKLFSQREVHKKYFAILGNSLLVDAVFSNPFAEKIMKSMGGESSEDFTIDLPLRVPPHKKTHRVEVCPESLGGKKALTRIQILERKTDPFRRFPIRFSFDTSQTPLR